MSALRRMLDTHGIDTKIVADGNVNTDTIPILVQHGASMLIGGTSGLFLKGRSVKECAQAMLDAYQQVRPLEAAERELFNAQLRAGALRFWISRLWDYHLPREAALLTPHDPRHFERVLRQRIAHPPQLA